MPWSGQQISDKPNVKGTFCDWKGKLLHFLKTPYHIPQTAVLSGLLTRRVFITLMLCFTPLQPYSKGNKGRQDEFSSLVRLRRHSRTDGGFRRHRHLLCGVQGRSENKGQMTHCHFLKLDISFQLLCKPSSPPCRSVYFP